MKKTFIGAKTTSGQVRSGGTNNEIIRSMLKDEDAFIRRAGPRELTQAVLYFRAKASKATTPQLRDFYLDRAHQFSIRAINGGIYGVYGVQRARVAG